ncbi:MAG: AMP-binding protein [Paracoccaceae bacterium]|nr:AMP-binding protein [Paracoccaceae bacterium]
MLERTNSFDRLTRSFDWDLPQELNMAVQACEQWADVDPERTAIIDMTDGTREDVSFGVLDYLADRLAVHLDGLGVGLGDRVAVFRGQSVWTAAAHIAIWKTGAISIPLFPLFGSEALQTRLSDSGAIAAISDVAGGETLRMLGDLPNLSQIIVPEQAAFDQDAPRFETVETGPEDPACLIYTSGTTGAPKGVLHGHRVLTGHLPGVELSHNFLGQSGDRIWTPADWAWIGGLFDVLMAGLALGVPVVASRSDKFDPKGMQKLIDQAQVKNVFLPPTALRMIKSAGVEITGLRSVATGGEPLGAEMQVWGQKAFGVTINEFYGQTECNMIISSCSELFEPKLGAMGRSVTGHSVDVLNEAGEPTKEEGDIAVRQGSASMMLEYWNKPEITAAKFKGDWMITGDRGIREGAYIRFLGREDDVISSAGYRIGPAEIEDCLMQHEAVATVGVIGKPDELRGEIVKAYVVLGSGHVASDALKIEMQERVKSRLSPHLYPREIEFVGDLPMTVTGKIIRKDLKNRAHSEGSQ